MKILILFPLALFPPARADGDCGAVDADGGLSSDLQSVVSTAQPGRGNGRVPKVFHGTERPSAVPLTDGQIMAVGSWGSCSGTVIADRWVLTANHCRIYEGQRFCIGQQAEDPIACLVAERVERNPDADMTLVYLDASTTAAAPGLEPIPLFTDALDEDWIGVMAEAAGYGQQEDGGYGEREFTAEPIVDLEGHELTIDGQGRRGVCFGDSGGPVMVQDADGAVGVAGTLSWGDPDCLGKDRYTRVDTNLGWLAGILGPLDELDMGGGEAVDPGDTGEALPDYTTGEGWWEPIEWR